MGITNWREVATVPACGPLIAATANGRYMVIAEPQGYRIGDTPEMQETHRAEDWQWVVRKYHVVKWTYCEESDDTDAT